MVRQTGKWIARLTLVQLGLVLSTATLAAESENVFDVHPQTAGLIVERTDFSFHSAPVVTRSFRAHLNERGIFGAGWCSNLDLVLTGAEEAGLKEIELRDCGRLPDADGVRKFNKVLDAWVEGSSGSRILRKSDGRWEQTEPPHAIFRPDGKLESFLVNEVRWNLRRNANAAIESMDSSKSRPVRFRRNDSGDLVALVDSNGKSLIGYRLSTMLESANVGTIVEKYEYDAEGNILKMTRSQSGAPSQLWRFSYGASDRVATVHLPDGCISKWMFQRSLVKTSPDFGTKPVAKESKSCRVETLGTAKPVSAVPSVKRATASSALPVVESTQETRSMVAKPGPLGVGTERAQVTVGREGLPVLFEIVDAKENIHRLEIQREPVSGSVVAVRSGKTEVNFKNRPREYDSGQLELLDEFEEWMAAWGSR